MNFKFKTETKELPKLNFVLKRTKSFYFERSNKPKVTFEVFKNFQQKFTYITTNNNNK